MIFKLGQWIIYWLQIVFFQYYLALNWLVVIGLLDYYLSLNWLVVIGLLDHYLALNWLVVTGLLDHYLALNWLVVTGLLYHYLALNWLVVTVCLITIWFWKKHFYFLVHIRKSFKYCNTITTQFVINRQRKFN